MSEYKSVARVTALQEAIEAKTGGSYTDLADGVQVLLDGYGQGGGFGGITPINAVTIVNDETHGYTNGILVPIFRSRIKKVKVHAKIKNPDDGVIWLCVYNGQPAGPYSVFGGYDANGVIDALIDTSNTNNNVIKIGGWTDATYSHTITWYELVLYGDNDVVIADLQPALNPDNEPGFFDSVNIAFYKNAWGDSFIAGEFV